MAAGVSDTGYFSLLRWRRDAARDEARNVAVLLVSADGRIGGMRAAPLSTISKNLQEQGILDALLLGLKEQFSSETKPTLEDVQRMHGAFVRSLVVTEPRPTAVPDEGQTLDALYRVYVSPRAGGRSLSKGATVERVAQKLRRKGLPIEVGKRIDSFSFDIVIGTEQAKRSVADVLSFATAAKEWMPVEHDAGYFIYAVRRLNVPGFAIFQPPIEASHVNAFEAHDRVRRLFKDERIPTLELAQLDAPELALPV